MPERHAPAAGPVRPGGRTDAGLVLRPADSAIITGGLWAERRRVNRDVSIPEGWQRLHEAGNFTNLALAGGRTDGEYRGDLPFLDSDVYKWLEAVGWVLADPGLDGELAERLRTQLAETEDLLRAAQQPDGYLDSHFQVRFPGERFQQLPWGHELYCAGHLIQAAIAVHRTTGDTALMQIARRVADLIVASFGTAAGQIDGVGRSPRDRDGARRALPRDRFDHLPRQRPLLRRPPRPRTARRRPVRSAVLAGSSADPRGRCRDRARRAPVVSARRGRRPRTSRPADSEPAGRGRAALARDGRPPRPTSPVGSARTIWTRLSAIRTSCRTNAATARPAPRSPRSCSAGECS